MAQAPNAILAINSLDRYIATNRTTYGYFYANWAFQSSQLTLGFPTNPDAPFGNVIIGADLSTLDPGLQPGTIVTSVSGTTWGSTINISRPMTNGNATGAYFEESVTSGQENQPFQNALEQQWKEQKPYSNDFTIQSPGALIYGYINRIVISQIQVEYNIPTVVKDMNDTFFLSSNTYGDFTAATFGSGTATLQLVSGYPLIGAVLENAPYWPPGTRIRDVVGNTITLSNLTISFHVGPLYIATDAENAVTPVTMPFGFYNGDELAAMMETQIQNLGGFWDEANITVTFDRRGGFIFTSTGDNQIEFYFPSFAQIQRWYGFNTAPSSDQVYKAYRLIGMSRFNANGYPGSTQKSGAYPVFLYTPYIDIFSDILTNYQSTKDTNTSISKPKGLISRIYLSNTGGVQGTSATLALGVEPFIMTSDLNTPKVIRWSPDVAVPSIDFQMRDCYGDLVPGAVDGFSTEFQMTLLCIEGSEWESR